jgi:hypothetical protein
MNQKIPECLKIELMYTHWYAGQPIEHRSLDLKHLKGTNKASIAIEHEDHQSFGLHDDDEFGYKGRNPFVCYVVKHFTTKKWFIQLINPNGENDIKPFLSERFSKLYDEHSQMTDDELIDNITNILQSACSGPNPIQNIANKIEN